MKTFLTLLLFAMIVVGCTPAQQKQAADTVAAGQKAGQVADDNSITAGNQVGGKVKPGSNKMQEYNDMNSMMQRGQSAKYMVTYALDSAGTAGAGEYTMYVSGQDAMRIDMNSGGQQSMSLIKDGESHTCTSQDGTKWQCFKSTVDQVKSNTKTAQVPITVSQVEDDSYAFARDGTQVVAGVTAACYKSAWGTYSSRVCLSAEGVMLYAKTVDANGESIFQATKYSTKVSDSVFELPAGATITDLSELQKDMQENSGDPAAMCRVACGFEADETAKAQCLANCV